MIETSDAVDAVEDGSNDYGTFYRVDGMLEGPIENLPVVCIWMKQAIDGRCWNSSTRLVSRFVS